VHWVNITYVSKCLGVTLSDHNLVSSLDELDAVFEFECYLCLVISLNILLVKYFNSLHGLTNTSNVQNCLVTSLDMRVVMQHLNKSIKVLDTKCLVLIDTFEPGRYWVNQARSFSDLVILDWLRIPSNGLDVHAN